MPYGWRTTARRALRPCYRFSWVVRGRIGGMGAPSPHDRLLWLVLRARGIRLVVSLTTDAPDPLVLSRFGLAQLHIPVPDLCPPTTGQIETFLDRYRQVTSRGHGVVVHCGAGLGRTGTMIALALKDDGSTADDAMLRVRMARPGSIETPAQERTVLNWITQPLEGR